MRFQQCFPNVHPFSVFLFVLYCSMTLPVQADPFDYFNPFDKYGTVANVGVCSGICAAVEMINSFVFLDNQYASVYPGNKLIPGNDPNRDAQWFSTAGWDGPNGHRDGF
jgi:hypothetical protein